MTPEQIELVMFRFGARKQIVKAIEENSELIQALSKFLNEDDHFNRIDKTAIIDELADVENMCIQLRHIFGISEQVDERKKFKVERLMKRIENQ